MGDVMKKLMLLLSIGMIFTSCINHAQENERYKIGLLVVATGKYIQFVPPLIESAEKYFCKDHDVSYVIFTDGQLDPADNIHTVYQERLGWPKDTLMRFYMYYGQKELLRSFDYLFACDADMLFVNPVGDEILGDRTAVIHPGYVGRRGTYETSQKSTAYVSPSEGEHYFAGGIYGGATPCFFHLLETVIRNIEIDFSNGLIAVWHDESHLNRYFIDHKPSVILSSDYCYPESHRNAESKKLLALDKNHDQVRK